MQRSSIARLWPPMVSWGRWATRQPLRQCQGGELHQDADGRGGLPDGLRDVCRRRGEPSRLHRRDLQLPSASLRPRLPEPAAIRGSTHPADGQISGLRPVRSQGPTPIAGQDCRPIDTGRRCVRDARRSGSGKGRARDVRSRVLRLTLLAPGIVEAILDGRQPVKVQLDDLLGGFPLEWNVQKSQFTSEKCTCIGDQGAG